MPKGKAAKPRKSAPRRDPRPASSPPFKAGDRVKVKQGDWGNATGTVQEVTASTVRVALDTNKRGGAVEFDRDNLARA